MPVSIVFPQWLRRSHPIVQRYLRQPSQPYFQLLVFLIALGVFLMLGGLSLPVLYFLFSLLILIQIATSSASKIYRERRDATWDLMRLAPLSSRELLLSMWAASLWQLNRTWMMIVYRLLHAVMTIGVIIFNLVFTEFPTDHTLAILFSGTILIVVQPFAEMYFSGMVGLAGANRLSDQSSTQGLVIAIVIVYWISYTAIIFALLLVQQNQPTTPQLLSIFVLPILLPLLLGGIAQCIAEASMR